MTDQNDEPKKPNVHAENNSIAVGGIFASGDISGNIHIGNIYQTPEDDLPLSSDEIENGLTRFAQFLPERAPVLQDSFSSIAKKLRATLGADQNSLSPALKTQREDGVDRMKAMCEEVLDIKFRAICLGQNLPPYDSRPPFLGLFAFRPEDREFFFGRDALVQKLVTRIKAYPFLAVLGASGSGKSSLVMAGLVPALEAQMSYLTPSSAPLSQLLTAKESASAKTVFVIDQFEELFTHPHDAAERADFIHALLELTKTNRVVTTMRADFWGEVAIYSDLKQAMQEHQELIAPMNVDELHSAMEKQAAVVGLRFDPTLSESILAEVKGEPGAMPLLQHALWELWNRRHGLWIKAEEYQAFGGVKQAIASTAEEVYASCSDFERARVRDIFLRLTRLDESGEGRDTRRRVLIEELIPVNSDSSVTIKLLNKLADSRLIVKNDKDVEVAHEALIRHWSRLTEWLNEDRDNLRLREGVSESAREWDASKRDDSLLNHRGGRLELSLAMSKLPRYQLNPIEQAYLMECVAYQKREQNRRERLRRQITTGLGVGFVVVLAVAILAILQWQRAERQTEVALARQLVAQAQPLFVGGNSKQQTAVLLAIQSMRMFPAGETAQILQNNTLARPISRIAYNSSVNSVAFSPDGRYVVSVGCDQLDSNQFQLCAQGSARVWEAATGKEIARMTHDIDVWSVAFSPDGKYVVSGGCDQQDLNYTCTQGSARVWEAASGKEVARMTHDGLVSSVAFSPDGKYVVSGGGTTASVWEANTGKEIARMIHNLGVDSVFFSFDGKIVVSGGCDQLDSNQMCAKRFARVWEAATGKEIARMTHDYGFFVSVAFSPDGKYVVSGGDTTARVWEATTGKEIARMTHGWAVSSVAFSPNGKYVVSSGSADGTARVWETSTGKEIVRMTHDSDVSSVTFSPDGKYVVTGGCDQRQYYGSCVLGSARVWKVNTEKEIARMTHDNYGGFVAFSPNSKYVVSGGCDELGSNGYTCQKGSARVWETVTGKEVASMIHDGLVSPVAFSPDGRYVVSGSQDVVSGSYAGTVSVWDATTGKEIAHMNDGYATFVAFSPDGKYVVSDGGATTNVWEASTGREIIRMTHDNYRGFVAFSPDGKYVVSSSDNGTARVWEATTGKEIAHMMIYDKYIALVAFSPDGKYVVSGSGDGTVRVWEAITGKETARMMHDVNGFVTSVAFSPNGKYVVSGSNDGTARVWETTTGKEIARMTHSGSDGHVSSVAFSPDGKYVVSGSYDGTVRVWEATTGKEIARMTHDSQVLSVAFSPNGKYMVSGTYNAVRVWIYRPEDLIAEACSRVTRNITRAEWKQYIGDALPYQAVCPNLPIEAESTPVP